MDPLKEQLAALGKELEGKSATQVKDALEAFDTQVKSHIEAEIKAGNEAIKTELEAKMKEIQDHADAMDAKLQAKTSATEKKSMAEVLEEKKAEFKSPSFQSPTNFVEIKADTLRANVADSTQGEVIGGIGQLARKKLSAYDLFPKFPANDPNNGGNIKYYDWDEATTVKAATMVAEGQPFPESTAKWREYVVPLRKVGDTLPVSEEFYEDSEMFAAELSRFLTLNVEDKIDDQIINGDNTGQNLNGINNRVSAYTPVQAGIADASLYDLMVKVKEGITTGRGAKYMPNFAFMNIADINKYKLKKDANNNYIMPPFVTAEGQVIDGMVVIENNNQTANTMVVGDSRYGMIYEKAGIQLSRGTVNAQFGEDMETLKVRRRLLFLIKNVDTTGFLKVTDIDAALVTLAEVPA